MIGRWMVLACVLLTMGLAFSVGAMPSVTETRVFTLEDSYLAVDLRGFNGSMEWVETEGPPRVELEMEVRGFLEGAMKRMLEDFEVLVDTARDTLTIEVNPPSKRFGATQASAVFRFFAPAEAVETFRAVTSNGSIRVDGFAADLDLRTSNGGITLGVGRGVVDAHTSNGRVELEFVEFTGSSSVRTSNGSIRGQMVLPDEGYYTFRTSNGSVELQLSGNLNGLFEMRTSNGTARLRLGDMELESRDIRYQGEDAGPIFTVETSNGNIRVTEF